MLNVTSFWLPKFGSTIDEYEDAFAFTDAYGGELGFRCAIADGATETSFSGLWAKILVQQYVNRQINELNTDTFKKATQIWLNQIAEINETRPLSWYAEQKLQQGAFSSLLGFESKCDGTWRAVCIGDSCIFHIRDRNLVNSFPFQDALQFNNHPALISTNFNSNVSLHETSFSGEWAFGDYFLLMTDALAQFFLSHPNHRKWLYRIKHPETFAKYISIWREQNLCRNDDITFVRLHVSATPLEQHGELA